MEFSGSNKEEALKRVSDAMPEFDNDVLDMLNNMTKKEKIEYLVNMFTEYFMGKFFREKVEDHFFGKDQEEKLAPGTDLFFNDLTYRTSLVFDRDY